MRPILSVIIPAYNVGNYITEAVLSVMRQTLIEFEIIVVDDGSTDNTKHALEDLDCDQRVKVISQSNLGTSQSRNTGLCLARGQYIGFLDGDDRWHPTKAARHIEVLEHLENIDLTFSRYRIIDDAGNDTGRRSKTPPQRVKLEDLIKENIVGTASNVIVRKEALDKVGYFDPNLKAAVDLDLWIRLAELRNNNMHFIDEILTDYRLRSGQISKDWQRVEQNWEKVIKKAMSNHPGLNRNIEHEARARFNRHLAYLAYESGDYCASRKLLRKAFSYGQLKLLLERRTWFTIAAVLFSFLPVKIYIPIVNFINNVRAYIFRPY